MRPAVEQFAAAGGQLVSFGREVFDDRKRLELRQLFRPAQCVEQPDLVAGAAVQVNVDAPEGAIDGQVVAAGAVGDEAWLEAAVGIEL
jgi:hypothetical protein